MAVKKDSYRVLGIAPVCSVEEIHSAYRALSKQWHPDVNPERREVAGEKMREVVEAYNVLRNAESRKDYDNQTHYRFRRTLQERGKKARAKIKVIAPSFFARLGTMLRPASKARNGPADPVKKSQEHFAMGLSMIGSSRFMNGAKREFELSAQLDPGYADAHFNLGLCCYQLGQYDESINALQKVLTLDRKDSVALALIQLLRDHEY